jgi:hypothetical protein
LFLFTKVKFPAFKDCFALKTNKPIVIFECGKGASDYYGTNPLDLYSFFNNEIGLSIYTLRSFLKSKTPLSSEEFERSFDTNEEYYFVAQ